MTDRARRQSWCWDIDMDIKSNSAEKPNQFHFLKCISDYHCIKGKRNVLPNTTFLVIGLPVFEIWSKQVLKCRWRHLEIKIEANLSPGPNEYLWEVQSCSFTSPWNMVKKDFFMKVVSPVFQTKLNYLCQISSFFLVWCLILHYKLGSDLMTPEWWTDRHKVILWTQFMP